MRSIRIEGKQKRSSRVWLTPAKEFSKLVLSSSSIVDLQKRLGYKGTSGAVASMLKQRINKERLSISHFHRDAYGPRPRRSLKSILVKQSTYTNKQALKTRLVSAGVLANKCCLCGQGPRWKGQSLVLQLDHVNGDCGDNRLGNLRLLCPNCHSQTDTFSGRSKGKRSTRAEYKVVRVCPTCGSDFDPEALSQVYCCLRCRPSNVSRRGSGNSRKIKPKICAVCGEGFYRKGNAAKCCSPTCGDIFRRRVVRPPKEELQDLVWKYPTVTVAKRLGVSDSAVVKWCKSYGIKKPPRGYWMSH